MNATPFETIFEDQHLIVISKPAGLLSQGESTGDENLVDLLRVRFGRNYVGLVHRLDRNTSGLMVVAKRSKSAERLSEQLKNGKLVREYHAILHGTIKAGTTEKWEHLLLKNEKTNEVRVVQPTSADAKKSKLAILKVTALKNFQFLTPQNHPTSTPLTLARFSLETGRSHQIRVQSDAMSHSLAGDTKYGVSTATKRDALTIKNTPLFHRPALHSCYLSFEHPMSHEKLEFRNDFAPDMTAAFSAYLV